MKFSDISQQIEQVASGYRYNKPPDLLVTVQELVARFLRFLYDLLNMLHINAPGLTDSHAVSNVLRVILVFLGIACLTALVVVLARRVKQIRLTNERTKIVGASASRLLTADDWQAEAERLAAGAQWREACRALYFSLLRLLDERGILQFSPTRTNYEYFYALVRKKELAETFRTLVSLVESTWFGNYHAERGDYDRCKQLVQAAIDSPDARVTKVP